MDVEKDESSLKASRVRSRTSGPPRTGDWIPFGTRGDPGMLYSCKANRAIADPNRRYVTDAAVKKRGNGGMLTHLLNNNERLFFCGERFVIPVQRLFLCHDPRLGVDARPLPAR